MMTSAAIHTMTRMKKRNMIQKRMTPLKSNRNKPVRINESDLSLVLNSFICVEPVKPDTKGKQAVPSLNIKKIQNDVADGYKSRSARPAFYNQHLLATESADMTTKQGHILLHKNIQLKYLGDENEELRNKVQNLERIVKANKEIMSTMLSQEQSDNQSASTSLDT